MSDKNLKLKLEAVLDKVKSLANIKADIKALEARLSKIKIQGTLNSPATRKEINAKLKLFAPKVKVDADTTQAAKKIKKLGQQNSKTTIRPTVDNSQIASDLKGTQKITKSFFDKFSNGILGSNLIRMSIQNVIQSIHNAISNIKELDTIKANIQSASGAGETEADAMMSSYNYMAKQLGSTTKEVGEAANEFLRMGETVADTNALIKSSMVLSKVGMMGNSEAAGYLISSMKGYRTAAADSISIVDKLTAADAETAVSASGLAEALSKCGHAANSSGVTMDRLIGYAAAVGETTQKSMSEVGSSFQSIFSRINNIRIGRLVDDESGELLSDTEALLNKLGIQLRNSADIYRDFDSVLDDIGKRWGNFTQAEQNSISTAIAGAKQRETFAALMDNYSDALNYSETAANSAGFALERYGVYQDSIEAKTNELTAAMEALSTNIITEDLFGGIIDASTGIVEFIDDTNLLKSTLASFAAIKISKIFVSMAAGITTAIKSTKQLTAAMALFDKGKSTANLKDIGKTCKGLTDKQLKLVLSTKGLTHQERLWILAGKGVTQKNREQTLATLGFSAAEDKATSSTFSLSGAMNALGTAFAMNPVGMTIGAIVIAATTMTAVLSLSSHAMEEIRQKAKELGDEFSSTQSDIDGYKTKIKELYATIHDSHSSIEDVTAARKDLMAVQDELIKKFGDEEESVQSINEAINGQSDALDTLTQRQWQETKNEFNKNGFWNDLSNGVHGYSDNTDRMLKEYEGHVAKLDLSLFNGFLNENSKNYKEFKKLLKEDFGANITWGDRGNELAEISGNATEVYKKLLDLQNFSDQFSFTDGFSNHLTSLANSTKELSEQYKDFYNQYILYEKIFKKEDYADSFNNINDAYQQYQDAYASGDEKAIDNAAANFSSTLSEATKDVDDKSIVDYFNNMYPSMQAVIDKWEFKTKIIPSIDMEELRGKNQNDILKMIRTEGEEDAEKVFNSILENAKEYGLINDINAEGIQKVLDLLVEWQILQGDIVSETAVKTPDFDSAAFTKVTKDLNSLSDIYQTFVSNMRKEVPTPVDASSLEALNETFGTLDGYQEFVTTLGSSSATADQAKASIAKLMDSYLQQNLRLDSCTKAQQKYVTSQLQAIGIINSEELVTKELAFQEAESALRKYDLANASTEAMQSMLLEAQGASLTKGEIYSLAAAEIAYGNNGLDFSGKIEQLKVLAKAYGSTALEAMAATAADRVANNHGTYESVMDDLMAEWNKVKDSSEIKWEPVNISSGASPKPAAQESEKEKDILSDLNSEMDKYQSKLKAVRDARETYNRHGRISLDQAQDILDADFKLLAAYGDEEAALESLGKAKLNEMQIQLARNAIHTINSITTEAAAVQYLAGANENLADATLDATEQALKQAVAFAKTRGDMQGAAAETILQGYQNGAQMLAQVDFSFDPSKAEKTAKNGRKY